VNKQQKIAFDHPCRLAEETIHPRFGRMLKNGMSGILTINSGYE
jgi:hypothetical protein